MSQIISFNPPRIPTVPQVPLPQTNFGILEHSGLPTSEEENVTDVPPHFEWMSEIQTFMFSFQFSKDNEIGTVIKTFSALAANVAKETRLQNMTPVWQHIPMTVSKWYNCIPSFKFIAVKPPRVTGKLLIRYSFRSPSQKDDVFSDFKNDKLRRGVCKEWDLGQSSEFEFDVVALNPIQARPTWLPDRALHNQSGFAYSASQMLSNSISTYGFLAIEVAQLLQPGGIFPDSIRIQVFRSLKEANFYVPTDPRSIMPHALGRPVYEKPELQPIENE